MHLTPNEKNMIETSSIIKNWLSQTKINKSIGPIVESLHRRSAQVVALLPCFDDEEATVNLAKILCAALTIELNRKCAVVIQEGIRHKIEHYPNYDFIYLPDVDLTKNAEKEIVAAIERGRNEYALLIVIGPNLYKFKSLSGTLSASLQRAVDAALLVTDHETITRDAIKNSTEYSNYFGVKIFGVLPCIRIHRTQI